MTVKWPLPFVLALGLTATRAASPTVTIDAASPSGKVSPLFYGLMREEINMRTTAAFTLNSSVTARFSTMLPQQRIGRSSRQTVPPR